MFTKNVYMFPSSHNSVGLDPNELFLHHHGMLPTHYSAGDPLPAANQCTTGKASKKDRHNKIYTAQGPRDRRVRLSIAVARKFFDLQESLGFDKPSKTLDWLLTKSKGAIKDLVQMREKGSSDAAKDGSSEYEVDSKNGADLKLKGAAKNPTPSSNLAKESRVKARARARERTREKMMSIKKLNNNGSYELNPTIPIQFINNQLKISGSSSNINVGTMLHSHYPNFESANDHQDLIQESKRKVKNHPSILGFQQNFIISSSNYGVPSPYNAAADQNWDVSSCFTSSHSNI